MDRFAVSVRNDSTGEVRVVEVASAYGVDAQIEALRELFKHFGWRRATALPATSAVPVAVDG